MRREFSGVDSEGTVTVATQELIIIEGSFPAQVMIDLRSGTDVVVLDRDVFDKLTEAELHYGGCEAETAAVVAEGKRKFAAERKAHKETKALLAEALQGIERLKDDRLLPPRQKADGS